MEGIKKISRVKNSVKSHKMYRKTNNCKLESIEMINVRIIPAKTSDI